TIAICELVGAKSNHSKSQNTLDQRLKSFIGTVLDYSKYPVLKYAVILTKKGITYDKIKHLSATVKVNSTNYESKRAIKEIGGSKEQLETIASIYRSNNFTIESLFG